MNKNFSDLKIEKKLNEFLQNNKEIFININTLTKGLSIPKNLLQDPNTTLKISYFYNGELKITSKKITTLLNFNGLDFHCSIPLSAIWGIYTTKEDMFLIKENIPDTIKEQITLTKVKIKEEEEEDKISLKSSKENIKKTKVTKINHLKLIK